MKILRPYQEDAFNDIRATVGQGVRRIVVQAPTGSGKTRLAAEIVVGAQLKGNPLVFVVPAISLIDQTVEMFAEEGIRDIGVIQADHPLTDWSKPVQIASIQTVRRREAYPKSSVVIFDEVHQLHAEHIKWLKHEDWSKIPFIGLSATPWTRGLGRFFDTLLVMSTTKELIAQGYLSPFTVFASDHPDLSGVKTVAGDYHEGQLSNVMQDNVLVANIIKTYQEKWGRGKTFCFAVDCSHAQMLQARFLEAGIPCGYQDARTPMSERKEIKRQFHAGEIEVVCAVGTLTTGVDWDVRCLILARPTKSEMLFVQIIGRSLRTADGKDKAIILDHTDTTMRLGFASDIHHEHLNGGRFDLGAKVIRQPRLPKPCPQCTCLIPVGVKVCPACGFERKIPLSPIIERDGVLVEFDGIFRKKRDRNPITYTMQEKERFYAQLKGYALIKGYREGWAFFKYKEKFKTEPPWSIQRVSPMACGPEVAGWIKHLQIEWARSKKNPNGRRRTEDDAG